MKENMHPARTLFLSARPRAVIIVRQPFVHHWRNYSAFLAILLKERKASLMLSKHFFLNEI